ncbi:MAG: DUF4012 domain-containing protein [Acidimicrobiia bacterium]|nr:DUF4012 domain-containing protein [Acidimicrobiia bacterium]
MTSGPGGSQPPARRRRRRVIIAVVVLVALGWTAAAGYQLIQAKNHAQAGLDQLETAQDGLDPAALIRGQGLPAMRSARGEFHQAADAADSALLVPFQVLPYVGRQVRSVKALTSGASTVVDVVVTAMERSTKELAAKTTSGADRIELLDRLGVIGREAAKGLSTVGLGPNEALAGPLERARRKFSRQLTKARRATHDVAVATAGVASMLTGPSHYLLLAANEGEMRSGSGMLLSAGILSTLGGQFSLGDMVSVTDLELPPGAVPATGDFGARWGWLGPTEEWRYLAMSPQFDVTGSLAAQMWKAKTGEDVDGVFALDAVALHALIKVSGPVIVDGKVIDEGNVINEILLQQYLDTPSAATDPESDLPANRARRDRNGVIARAIVDQLDKAGWDIADLVDDLRSAARGRHVLFWSSKPEQQRAWAAAGVSGVLPRTGFMVSVENRGGNKLDQFLPVETTITHRKVKLGTRVRARITLRNQAPGAGLSRYVEGPYPFSSYAPGEYRGILSINIPSAAGNVSLDGVSRLVAAGADGSSQVIAGDVGLLRGESKTYTVEFTVPADVRGMEVVPSARFPAIHYSAGSHTWDDDGPHSIRW